MSVVGCDGHTPTGQAAATVCSRVPMGRMVVTANACNILTDADIDTALARHQSGDWGEVSEADWKANDNAIKDSTRLLSAYISGDGNKFWVITEADRTYTTILTPDDY